MSKRLAGPIGKRKLKKKCNKISVLDKLRIGQSLTSMLCNMGLNESTVRMWKKTEEQIRKTVQHVAWEQVERILRKLNLRRFSTKL